MSDGQVVIDINADDKQFAGVIAGLGKAAAIGLAAVATAVLGVGIAGLSASTEFNKGMANVASLIPGNVARVDELKGVVQDMAVEFGSSTGELTTGLYQSISAFGDTADTVKLLEINTKAAAAGVASTADAINLTSAVTKAYGDTSEQAVQKAADLALMTVRLGQTTFPELAASIGRVTPMSKNLGISQEELFATMATLTGVTGGAAEVSTQLASAQRALANPTDAATEAFKKRGYASAQAAIDDLGYVGALGVLTDAAKKTHKPLAEFITDTEGQTFAMAITGAQAGDYTKKLGEMKNAAGTTDEAFKEQTTGVNALGFAFEQGKQLGIVALQMLGDAIGNAFGPDVSAGLETVKGMVDSFRDSIDLGIAPIAAVRGAIGEAFGPDAVTLFDNLKGLVDNLVDAVSFLVDGFKQVGDPAALSGIDSVFYAVGATVGGIVDAVMLLVDGIRQVGDPAALSGIDTVFYGMGTAVNGLFESIKAVGQWVLDNKEWIAPLVVGVSAMVIAYKAWTAAQAAWVTITTLATAVQATFNAVMAANPIGIVILAIIGLVAALAYAWTHSEKFREIVTGAWEAIKNATVNAFNSVVAFFKKWGPVMLLALGGPIVWAVAFIIKHWDEIKAKTVAAFNGAKDLAIKAFNALKEGVISIATKVVNYIKGYPANLVRNLGNLSSLLSGAGRAIIQGLWDGMKALWEKAKNWVSGIADWIAQHKGPISKDAKLLRPAGLAIMEGLLDGLKEGWKPVASLLDGYTTSLSGDIGMSMAALAHTPGGFTPSAATYGGSGAFVSSSSSRSLNLATGAIQIVLPAGTPAQTQQAAGSGVLDALAREWKRS